MGIRTKRIAIVSCMIFLAGCNQEHAGMSEPDRGEPRSVLAAPAAVDSASTRRAGLGGGDEGVFLRLAVDDSLPGLERIVRADSWDARLAELSAEERVYLDDSNDRYFEALVFHSADEQADLVSSGFPMPEEWLAAASMSESELGRLSRLGNTKAQIFYIDSVLTTFGPRFETGGLDANKPADAEALAKINEAKMMALHRVALTRSPFAAYQAALFLQQTSQGHDPAVAASGFQLAKELGDHRAMGLAQRYSARHADIDAMTVMASYSMIKSLLRGQ